MKFKDFLSLSLSLNLLSFIATLAVEFYFFTENPSILSALNTFAFAIFPLLFSVSLLSFLFYFPVKSASFKGKFILLFLFSVMAYLSMGPLTYAIKMFVMNENYLFSEAFRKSLSKLPYSLSGGFFFAVSFMCYLQIAKLFVKKRQQPEIITNEYQ